jgi:hypothetical protein
VLCAGANAATKKLLLASAAQPSAELLDQAAQWFSRGGDRKKGSRAPWLCAEA